MKGKFSFIWVVHRRLLAVRLYSFWISWFYSLFSFYNLCWQYIFNAIGKAAHYNTKLTISSVHCMRVGFSMNYIK